MRTAMEDTHRPATSDRARSGLPRTETERILLEIWSAILSTDRFGVDDDFLTLGGDSLAAMRCINRVRTMFGVELSLEVFFLEPANIVEVAAQLDNLRSETSGAQVARRASP